MCYFTDKDYLKTLKGQFKEDDIELVAKCIFNRALKLQIGCGTEPTLYKNLEKIIGLGKQYKVPYISITTNANLLDEQKIESLLKAGLDEFTISLHGVTKESYESFMKKASYEKFQSAFKAFGRLKTIYNFKVRVNYTFNKDNFHELNGFFDHFDADHFDILQIRPIQKIGNTEYNDFDISTLADTYSDLIQAIKVRCIKNNIVLLAPKTLSGLTNGNQSSFIFDYTFCYISPNNFWKKGFNWREESFNEFSRKIKWSQTLFLNIFKSKTELRTLSNRLNYDIEFY